MPCSRSVSQISWYFCYHAWLGIVFHLCHRHNTSTLVMMAYHLQNQSLASHTSSTSPCDDWIARELARRSSSRANCEREKPANLERS
jgi:hypothetical protein